MTDVTLPTKLQAEALGEIMEYQAKLFQDATGEFPQADATDVIATSADLWVKRLIPLLMPPAYYSAPEFDEIADQEVKKKLFNSWIHAWYDAYVLKAQNFGLSEKTAKAVVDHLHGRTA